MRANAAKDTPVGYAENICVNYHQTTRKKSNTKRNKRNGD